MRSPGPGSDPVAPAPDSQKGRVERDAPRPAPAGGGPKAAPAPAGGGPKAAPTSAGGGPKAAPTPDSPTAKSATQNVNSPTARASNLEARRLEAEQDRALIEAA